MRQRNQRGSLSCKRRRNGPSCWEFSLARKRHGQISKATNNCDRDSGTVSDKRFGPSRRERLKNVHQPKSKSSTRTVDPVADLVDHYVITEIAPQRADCSPPHLR